MTCMTLRRLPEYSGDFDLATEVADADNESAHVH